MSHDFESGFFVCEPPWHGLGTVLPDAPQTSLEAITAAGLNWEVSKETMEAVVSVNGIYRAVGVPDHYAVIRRKVENGITRLDSLGVVGQQYRPIQNIDAFSFFDRVVQTGMVDYHTAGSLKGGRIIWALARIHGTMRIAGDDVVDKYLLLTNSHDGSSPVHIAFTPIRVVCANTLAMALKNASSDRRLSIRHTACVAARIRDVGEYLAGSNARFDDSAEAYRFLAQRSIHAAELTRYLMGLFPDPVEGALRNRARANREKVTARFERGFGTDLTGASWWRAYNAVVEFIDHDRNQNNADARVHSAWLGQGMQLKQQALTSALQLAA
jgi:phage/plasmid-like protein (TIGR03299 family)